MSLISRILRELWDTELNYKGVRVNIFGIPKFACENKRSLSSSAYWLNKQGLISKNQKGARITSKGRKFLEEKGDSLKNFPHVNRKGEKKDLLVIYDIPENLKTERDWFRLHLKKFGFIMIQRSVWVGPAQLPKEFIEYVKEIGIRKTFRTFKLSAGYNHKDY